ncbi:MAG: dicarboxylate/amino acid:cation symporter [Bacteroidetes bacterium HGW-Bacteroidetes-17]|nr:MAG: dicarboxylate/amino acid:cation symporter [Bacteroidetes bacterium HGW-Bacteroidetes-17]
MRKIRLHWQILIALILAIIYGIIFSNHYSVSESTMKKLTNRIVEDEVLISVASIKDVDFTSRNEFQNVLKKHLSADQYQKHGSTIVQWSVQNPYIKAVDWMGILFLKMLKLIMIPLILSSLISGISNVGSVEHLGRLGLKTMIFYMSTSLIAILTGLFFVNLFKPGIGADLNFSFKVEGLMDQQRSFKEIILDIVPDNIFTAFNDNQILSVIFFAILFGFFITQISPRPRQVLTDAFNAIFDVMMKITMFFIKFTPLGIFGIVSRIIAEQDDLGHLVQRMSLYMGTIILAMSVHFLITLPLIISVFGRVNPWKHMKNMTLPLLTAFSTSSSSATLPLTMNAVENNSGVSRKISSFTLPLGATINMDGAALYECVAAIFIAQAYGIDLTVLQQIIIVFTALLASIGSAGIPMAGLVMITIVLSAVGLPLEGVGLILAVDRLIDMFRTATNVWSDTCGAVVIAKLEGEKLPIDY